MRALIPALGTETPVYLRFATSLDVKAKARRTFGARSMGAAAQRKRGVKPADRHHKTRGRGELKMPPPVQKRKRSEEPEPKPDADEAHGGGDDEAMGGDEGRTSGTGQTVPSMKVHVDFSAPEPKPETGSAGIFGYFRDSNGTMLRVKKQKVRGRGAKALAPKVEVDAAESAAAIQAAPATSPAPAPATAVEEVVVSGDSSGEHVSGQTQGSGTDAVEVGAGAAGEQSEETKTEITDLLDEFA